MAKAQIAYTRGPHKPLIVDGVAYLTPPLFAELDRLSRIEAGKPIGVFRYKDDPRFFAKVSFMAGSVRKFPGGGITDMCIIDLAESIPLGKFYDTVPPELDWSAIHEEDVYDFAVLHEIAHTLHGDTRVYFDVQFSNSWIAKDPNALASLQNYFEMRADRLAWSTLYPDKTLPVHEGRPGIVKELEGFYRHNKALLDAWKKRPKPKPISTAPGEMVPIQHEKGIPWSNVVRTAFAA